MNSLAISGYFAVGIILLVLWAVIVANREPPPAKMKQISYAGRDINAFTKAWRRKLQRIIG